MTRITNNYPKISQGQGAPSFGALHIKQNTWEKLIKISKNFNTPEQRMVIGASAVFLQPLIDLSNKKVDDRTRQGAASRSFSRAIIGTLTGIAVRESCIGLGKFLTREGGACYINALENARPRQIRNYSKTIGNVLALATLVATNFLIDVQLINKMSAYINEKVFGNKPKGAK